MHQFRNKNIVATLLVAAALFSLACNGFAPEDHSAISAEEFIRALAAHRAPSIDSYLARHMNPNARARQERPLILAAVLQGEVEVVHRLLDAGACVDLADETGMTPLMAAALIGNVDLVQKFLPLATNPAALDRNGLSAFDYAVAAGKSAAVEILLPTVRSLDNPARDGRAALTRAVDAGNPEVVNYILDRLPPSEEWNRDTLEALNGALAAGNKDQVKLLVSKRSAAPIPDGKSVPLVAYAIAANNPADVRTLLECGVDPNTMLPDKCDADFLALLPAGLRGYIEGDKGVPVLMLAAGLGQCDSVRALLAAGADRERATRRYKMIPLYVAAQTGKWQCSQILLGSGPPPEQLRIEISLASQKADVIKDGVPIFSTVCSTGRSGYSTRTGDYIITDKDRSHRSTIYKVEMPYFMRLSCLDFGMHEGVVPNYPASHGCIRLPGEAARKLFAEIPVGTLVTVK